MPESKFTYQESLEQQFKDLKARGAWCDCKWLASIGLTFLRENSNNPIKSAGIKFKT